MLVWILLWLPRTWTYRVVGPGRPSWTAAFGGAVGAATALLLWLWVRNAVVVVGYALTWGLDSSLERN